MSEKPGTDPVGEVEEGQVASVGPPPDAEVPVAVNWSGAWQLPVLIAGVVMLVLGLWTAVPEKEPDNFAAGLDSVEQFLGAKNYGEAEEHLNKIHEHRSGLGEADQARYNLLRGDLVYLQQLQMGWDKTENHESILRCYGKARDQGQTFDDVHLQHWVYTLVALGRDDEAMGMLDQLEGNRYVVIRRVIERRSAMPDSDTDELFSLLAQFQEELRRETDQEKRRDQQLWAAKVNSRLMIDTGAPDKAIDYVLHKLVQLDDGEKGDGPDQLAPLMVNLAKAYQRVGDNDEAKEWFTKVQGQLDKMDSLNADVMVGLAQIVLAEVGDVEAALGYFGSAESLYPSTEAYLDALIGRADCEARLGGHAEAIEHFGHAVTIVEDDPRPDPADISNLVNVVRSHYDLNFDSDRTDRALDYLTLLLPLYPKELPTRLLREFAVTHEKIGGELLADSARLLTDTENQLDAQMASARAAARRTANQEAAMHFKLAGEYYRRHAHAVTVSDNEQHGESLWQAAVNYDKAQRWDRSIEVYAEFVQNRGQDPKHLLAVNRLGLAYLADNQPEAAAEKFGQLMEQNPNSEPAQASRVPLARALIAVGKLDDAQARLESVVNDDPAITPKSRHYRDALIELSRLHYWRGQFTKGIPLLQKAVKLYGDLPDGPVLRFRWADALRQSIEQLDESLAQPLAQSKQLALAQERTSRLTEAQQLFDRVVDDLSPRSPAELSKLQRLFLRNAYFFRADCAYDRGRFAEAIDLYDEAAKQFQGEPVSLVALVQIVNAYCELGDTDSAKAVNHRARLQLRGIPDEKFDDPSLPMSRRHWEDWLRWSSQLKPSSGSQASAAGADLGG